MSQAHQYDDGTQDFRDGTASVWSWPLRLAGFVLWYLWALVTSSGAVLHDLITPGDDARSGIARVRTSCRTDLLLVAAVVSAYRILVGPLDADRAVSGDLLTFSVTGMVTLFGVRAANVFTFDLVLIAAITGFLTGMSLARALTRGRR
ncbi:monovalent cation/H+ antiporter complex subunit F [Streptomyces sp. NPDC127092]|uniref:monovalent cation/H+ antiporter complex subunit F n=1 Tax=Streptomyces sp. NPDC127092 TaxID=3347135 RepID=UPI003652DD28